MFLVSHHEHNRTQEFHYVINSVEVIYIERDILCNYKQRTAILIATEN